MNDSGPPTTAGPVGREATITKHSAKLVPCGHNGTVRSHYCVDGTRLNNISPDGMGLAPRDLAKGFVVKRHYLAAHMVLLTATVLKQVIQN